MVANDPRSVLVVPSDSLAGADPASAGRPTALDSDVRDVSIGSDGCALLSMDRQVVKLNLTSGEQTSIPVDGQANSAVELNDGRIAIGTDNGSVHIVDPKNDQSQTVSGFASVDELAVTGDNLSASITVRPR